MAITKCCLCIPLRGGVITLGLLFLLTQCISVVDDGILMHKALHNKTENRDFFARDGPAMAGTGLAVSLVFSLSSFLMLIGAIRLKSGMLKPHLILQAIALVVLFAMMIVFVVRYAQGHLDEEVAKHNESHKDKEPITVKSYFYFGIGLKCFMLVLGIYFWFVVRAFYRVLKKEQSPDIPVPSPPAPIKGDVESNDTSLSTKM